MDVSHVMKIDICVIATQDVFLIVFFFFFRNIIHNNNENLCSVDICAFHKHIFHKYTIQNIIKKHLQVKT